MFGLWLHTISNKQRRMSPMDRLINYIENANQKQMKRLWKELTKSAKSDEARRTVNEMQKQTNNIR